MPIQPALNMPPTPVSSPLIDRARREIVELVMARIEAAGYVPGEAIDLAATVIAGRDLLLGRALPYLEQLLALQGDAPDRDLLALQHELAAHLAAVPPLSVNQP